MNYRQGEMEELQRQLQRRLEAAVKDAFAEIQDHANFTLQRAYFKCAYECFDRRIEQQEITHCVEKCGVPVRKASSLFDNEIAKFQERLQRNLMVCQDKFEDSRLTKQESSYKELEQCMRATVDEQINTLPHLAAKLKSQMPADPYQQS